MVGCLAGAMPHTPPRQQPSGRKGFTPTKGHAPVPLDTATGVTVARYDQGAEWRTVLSARSLEFLKLITNSVNCNVTQNTMDCILSVKKQLAKKC